MNYIDYVRYDHMRNINGYNAPNKSYLKSKLRTLTKMEITIHFLHCLITTLNAIIAIILDIKLVIVEAC